MHRLPDDHHLSVTCSICIDFYFDRCNIKNKISFSVFDLICLTNTVLFLVNVFNIVRKKGITN